MAMRLLPLLVSLAGLALALPGARAQSPPLFAGPYEAATGPSPYDLGVGDFDGDGLQDLALPNYGSDDVSVLLGGSGHSLYLQSVVADGAAPCGAALSNALRADVP